MGTVLFVISILCVAVGTWKLLGIIKTGKPGSKWLWGYVTAMGILLFLFLKLWETAFVSI
ncbi:hypothetical protein [Brevibacillus fulvus]|uniref:Uncharacterized protein n=1 Tax=Brevibacillus fulvus TaxID=1125967 RepID=A0A938XSS6_9BACL|nr:hypothetical protein [Brevibacillus fulvus]MBM7589748.1 hypothetical protein [Brevibacillus fulvus]